MRFWTDLNPRLRAVAFAAPTLLTACSDDVTEAVGVDTSSSGSSGLPTTSVSTDTTSTSADTSGSVTADSESSASTADSSTDPSDATSSTTTTDPSTDPSTDSGSDSGSESTAASDSTATSESSASATDATGSSSDDSATTGVISTTDPTDASSSSSDGGTSSSSDGGTSSSSESTTTSTTAPACPQGEIQCNGNTAQTCDGLGGFTDVTPCGQSTCVAGVGCVFCDAGEYRCNGESVEQCNATEDAWVQVLTCDAVQGLACNAQSGQCSGSCAAQNLGTDEVGCEFYPTITGNIAASEYAFQVVVVNTTIDDAEISIDRDGNQIESLILAGGESVAIPLPWIENLKQSTAQPVASVLEPAGAYRLRSTQPIVVTQWSPLADEGGAMPSGSNESSLLYPTHVWGDDVMVASRNTWQLAGTGHIPGFYAITALEDATTVTLVPSPTSSADVLPGGGVAADGSGVIMLDRGDVLEVFSGGAQANPSTVDLTGTRILADAPIQVIGGHIYTDVPYNVSGPDHIEESMPPVASYGTVFVSTPPFASLPGGAPAVKRRRLRVIATEANTSIVYDPPQAGQPTMIAEAGGYAEVTNSAASFELVTSAPALVVEYMVGYNSGNINAGTEAGDPALAIQQPVSAWKQSYRVHAPEDYYAVYANIITPIDVNVTLDGVVLGGWFVFGGEWKLRRVELTTAGTGVHAIEGTGEFGVTVYGYGEDVGFWTAGGYDFAP